jgi:hypothetical protein
VRGAHRVARLEQRRRRRKRIPVDELTDEEIQHWRAIVDELLAKGEESWTPEDHALAEGVIAAVLP